MQALKDGAEACFLEKGNEEDISVRANSRAPANDKKIPFPEDVPLPSARNDRPTSITSTVRMRHPRVILSLQTYSPTSKGTEAERACGGTK